MSLKLSTNENILNPFLVLLDSHPCPLFGMALTAGFNKFNSAMHIRAMNCTALHSTLYTNALQWTLMHSTGLHLVHCPCDMECTAPPGFVFTREGKSHWITL